MYRWVAVLDGTEYSVYSRFKLGLNISILKQNIKLGHAYIN